MSGYISEIGYRSDEGALNVSVVDAVEGTILLATSNDHDDGEEVQTFLTLEEAEFLADALQGLVEGVKKVHDEADDEEAF